MNKKIHTYTDVMHVIPFRNKTISMKNKVSMKKMIILVMILACTAGVHAQKLISKNGHVRFYSHTPVEDIEGNNRQVVSILNRETGDLQVQLLVKSFEFEKKLMQEHFNENYMESDTWPKSTFKGKIEGLNAVDFSADGTYPVTVTGNLTVRDVTRPVEIKGKIVVSKGQVSAESSFHLKPEDYGIIIPDVVRDNIAKEFEVFVTIPYTGN